jgi:hypothetical protein
MTDIFKEHGVTVERFARVIARDALRFALVCCHVAGAAELAMDWIVWMVKS